MLSYVQSPLYFLNHGWHREVTTVIVATQKTPQEKSSPSFIQHGKCLRRTTGSHPPTAKMVPMMWKFATKTMGPRLGVLNIRGKDCRFSEKKPEFIALTEN
jgi:hypothetical protein